MKRIFYIVCAIALLAGCNRSEDDKNVQGVPSVKYPIEAGWMSSRANDGVYVIRSMVELSRHLGNLNMPVFPIVDFAKYTLLIAEGGAQSGISGISENIYLWDGDKYVMQVNVLLNQAAHAPRWRTAVLVPVIPAGARVDLDVKYDR